MEWPTTVYVIYFLAFLLILWISKRYFKEDQLRHLPGPKGLPLLGSLLDIENRKVRVTLQKWAQQYGGVYRVRLAFGDVIVLSEYKYIHHVLVSDGHAFAGIINPFRVQFLNGDRSVGGLQPTDPSWGHIRKASQRYLKQFGSGMSRLEDILSHNVDYMLQQFHSAVGQPVNVMETVKSTSLRSISVLLLGRSLDDNDPLMEEFLSYERRAFEDAGGTELSSLLIDVFPFLIHFPIPPSRRLKNLKAFQQELWVKIKAMQSDAQQESLTKVFLDIVPDTNGEKDVTCTDSPTITELEAAMSVLSLILAGTGTTSRVLYCIFNVLAFNQTIQQRIHDEIRSVMADGRSSTTVADRARMPYLQATILECMRAFHPIPTGGMPHTLLTDSEIPGYGIIPKGTVFIINIWALHHDIAFWKDPEVIRPERFLDKDRQFLTPDHPNRKHVLPFGAGPRVCLGEVFARTRLFLWTVAVLAKFRITPSPDSDKKWMDPNVHWDNILLEPLPNKVIFHLRK